MQAFFLSTLRYRANAPSAAVLDVLFLCRRLVSRRLSLIAVGHLGLRIITFPLLPKFQRASPLEGREALYSYTDS